MTLRHIGLGASLLGCLSMQAAAASAQAAAAPRGQHTKIDKVDLLFVVDNSNSMAGEQASLRAHIPELIEKLTENRRNPITDLHVGVVSTDMGIPGVEFPPSCHADGGDDGRLRHQPDTLAAPMCDADYPQYQSEGRPLRRSCGFYRRSSLHDELG